MSYHVELEMLVGDDGKPLSADALEELVHEVMPLVVDLPEDVDLAVDVARSSLTFCVQTSLDVALDAMARAEEIAVRALASVGLQSLDDAAQAGGPARAYDEASLAARRPELATA